MQNLTKLLKRDRIISSRTESRMGDEMTNTYDDNQHDREDNKQDKVLQVYELIKKAKGPGRSFAAYAKAAGVSPASLTKIKNGEYMPSPDIMRKLTSDAADPQGGVTYDDLMRAAGYADHLMAYADMFSSRTGATKYNSFIMQASEYEKNCSSLVYTTLVNKGIAFRKEAQEVLINVDYKSPDLVIQTMDLPIATWCFEFRYYSTKTVNKSWTNIYATLGSLLILPCKSDTKLSLVVNSDFVFQKLVRFDHALSFRAELSVVLVDIEKGKIVDEIYLSNYYEGDRSREVYMTEDK